MLDTFRHNSTNTNFLAWDPVAVDESSYFTPAKMPLPHTVVQIMEWPSEVRDKIASTIDLEITQLTPANADLNALASKYPPGQVWFAEGDDEKPF